MKRYEFIEHTSDMAVKIYGGSLKELFSSAALALFAGMVRKKANRQKSSLRQVCIEVSAESLEDLLKEWLDELLFYFSTKNLVLDRIKALECSKDFIKAKILFDEFDSQYYEFNNEIKAVTYHELKVIKVRNGWQAFIIFDV